MSIYDYKDFDEEEERKLYSVIETLRKIPGAIIGKPSLDRFHYFLSGFEFGLMILDNYRPHFDRDFQDYVVKMYQGTENLHWNNIIGKDISDEEAFWKFFEIYDKFRKFDLDDRI